MSFRRTRAMFGKEFRHIVRDPRSLTMALAMPLLMLLLFGYALNLDVDRIPTLVYDADHSATSRELIQRFQGSRYFDIRGFAEDDRAIEQGIDRNTILMGISIPRDYSQRIQAGERANIQILLDGSDSNTASIALGYAESIMGSYAYELRSVGENRSMGLTLNVPIDPRLRVWYNNTLESKNYVVPGLVGVILMIIAALLTSLTVSREFEVGTLEQLLSTPVRASEIVLGKMLAFFLIGAVDALTSILAGIYVFHVPFRGSVPLLAATTCVFLSGAFFMGILVSAVAKSQLLAFQLGVLTSFLPSFLLSGFIYAIENMPQGIQVITRFVPARYFITILKGIFLKGVGLDVLWPEFAFLAGFATLVFFLATRKLSQKLA
ncbi:MAG TPA: ABC transporter permease [Bryobacteraceae bacterium]|jgi:ABC-2 type transport system permease protein|nr:ABC transporter permease [Bryobacteraceae bacterium]